MAYPKARALPTLATQPGPTFATLHDLSVYARDDLCARPATLTLTYSGCNLQYLRTPPGTVPDWYEDDSDDDEDDDGGLKYAFARSALAALRRGPRDAAASELQKRVRGEAVRRRLRKLERARARWRHRDLSRAFRTWEELARAMGIAAYSLKAVVGRMLHSRIARAWRTWREHCVQAARREAVKRRVLGKLYHKWYRAAWRSWSCFVERARAIERILNTVARRWMFAASHMAWQTWLRFLDEARRQRQALLVRRVLSRLFDSLRANSFDKWKRVARRWYLLDRIIRKTFVKALKRWRSVAASKAFDKWRLATRRKKYQRHAPKLRLLGAGSACPVPIHDNLAGVEERLRTLEHLAKQLHILRLERQLGDARACRGNRVCRCEGCCGERAMNKRLVHPQAQNVRRNRQFATKRYCPSPKIGTAASSTSTDINVGRM